MPNIMPNATKKAFLDGGINLLTADVRAVFVDTANAADAVVATDVFMDAITPAARIGTPTALTGKATTDGTFSAFTTTIPSVTGAQSEAVVLYLEPATGASAATRRILVYLDGLTVIPNGGNQDVKWNNTSTTSVAGPIFSF